jgi:WD40 repeat protein
MHRRSFVLTIIALFFLVACNLFAPVERIPPTATGAPFIVTQAPTLIAATQTHASHPGSLEVINAGNWSRLQLLQTFPAEMPLSSAIAISPDGKTLAVGGKTGAEIFLFDVASGQLLQTVSIGLSQVGEYFYLSDMEYLPDGTIMVNSSGPYAIYHIDAAGNILSRWDGINFAISADKKMIAHYTMEAGIVLTEIATNTSLHSLEDPDAMDFSFSPDDSILAAEDVGVDYLHVEIWDIPNLRLLTTLDETANPRFSPDGRFLAVTKYDYENDRTPLKIFSPDGTSEVTSLDVSEAHGVSNVAPLWSLDGSIIVAQVAAGSPIAWETTNWQPLESPALQGELHSLSPDGRILITRADDGAILLWGVLP